MSQQVDLEGNTTPRHLTKRHAGSQQTAPELLKSREWYCTECSSKVTRSPDGNREYGHKRECSHKLRRKSSIPELDERGEHP